MEREVNRLIHFLLPFLPVSSVLFVSRSNHVNEVFTWRRASHVTSVSKRWFTDMTRGSASAIRIVSTGGSGCRCCRGVRCNNCFRMLADRFQRSLLWYHVFFFGAHREKGKICSLLLCLTIPWWCIYYVVNVLWVWWTSRRSFMLCSYRQSGMAAAAASGKIKQESLERKRISLPSITVCLL